MYNFYNFYVFAKKDDKFYQNIEDSTSDIFNSIKISAPKQLSIYHKDNTIYYIYTKQNKKGYVGFATKFEDYLYDDFATALKVHNRIIDYINYKNISDAQRYSDLKDFVKKSFHNSKFVPCEEKKERKGKQATFDSLGLDTNEYFKTELVIDSINNNNWTYITIIAENTFIPETEKKYTKKQAKIYNTLIISFGILLISSGAGLFIGFWNFNLYLLGISLLSGAVSLIVIGYTPIVEKSDILEDKIDLTPIRPRIKSYPYSTKTQQAKRTMNNNDILSYEARKKHYNYNDYDYDDMGLDSDYDDFDDFDDFDIKTTEQEWKPSPTEWLGGYLLAEKMFDKMFKNKK